MNKLIENLFLAAILVLTLTGMAEAQTPKPAPTAKPQVPAPPSANTRRERTEPPMPAFTGGDRSERSLKVDPGVNLNLCISQGSVKVNGWSRNELRVLVNNGVKFAMKVQETNKRSGDPGLVTIDPVWTKNKFIGPANCIWGDEIEIDLPINAVISIKSQESSTTVDSVRKVSVNTSGGDVVLRNISGGASIISNRGDITLEESQGDIDLRTTTGNILVFEAAPSEIGNIFKANTNSGSIALQGLEFRQVDVNSISGSLAYTGNILNGGSYSFRTNRGSIKLAMPVTTACQINATFRAGSFDSDIPFQMETENLSPGSIKNVIGRMGKGGDAKVQLFTVNGSINIRKQ